jgi:hypothetical protein
MTLKLNLKKIREGALLCNLSYLLLERIETGASKMSGFSAFSLCEGVSKFPLDFILESVGIVRTPIKGANTEFLIPQIENYLLS